ncbi:Magnesium transporter [Corchorus olitorius]|uniref:Magnesium transporter n=1 Tax=Corchorus olitorius TaxID=93759 RepID=A0A1R3HTW9_9ROSI|nr:Magnesium transporter [Corchorus olitorius]
MEEEFRGPPINVVLELVLGFIFCIWAALTVFGKFLSIHPDSEENRIACQFVSNGEGTVGFGSMVPFVLLAMYRRLRNNDHALIVFGILFS